MTWAGSELSGWATDQAVVAMGGGHGLATLSALRHWSTTSSSTT